MIAIFSPQWFDALNAALAASRDVPSDASLRLGYRVVTEAEPIEYTIVAEAGTAALEVGINGGADVVFTQSLSTAIALATAQTTAHEAFMTGLLAVEGDTQKLVGIDTDWLDAAQTSVRTGTDFATGSNPNPNPDAAPES